MKRFFVLLALTVLLASSCGQAVIGLIVRGLGEDLGQYDYQFQWFLVNDTDKDIIYATNYTPQGNSCLLFPDVYENACVYDTIKPNERTRLTEYKSPGYRGTVFLTDYFKDPPIKIEFYDSESVLLKSYDAGNEVDLDSDFFDLNCWDIKPPFDTVKLYVICPYEYRVSDLR